MTVKKERKHSPPALHLALNKVNKLVIGAGYDFVLRFEYDSELPESVNDKLILESIGGHHRIEKNISQAKKLDTNHREIIFEEVQLDTSYHMLQQSDANQEKFYLFKDFNIYEMVAIDDERENLAIVDFSEQ